MKTLIGTTGRAVRRRGISLDRLAVLTLPRDQFADSPGSPLTLYLGERTHYRAAAWLLDEFQRGDGALGAGYGEWFDALRIENRAVTADVLVGTDSFAVHSAYLPRDQYAEVTIKALEVVAGAEVLVGVGLRLTQPGGADEGYIAQAVRPIGGGGLARLIKYSGGASSTLDEVSAPWVVGDSIRLVAEWNRLRVYRNGVLVLEHFDASPIAEGGAGIQVRRLHASDLASVVNFVAGPWRQEYSGALTEIGSISASLGLIEPTATPAAWDYSVVNCTALGGTDRFASLIRHGENDGVATYDVERAETKVMVAVQNGSAPLRSMHGLVEQVTDMTRMTCRVACRGRDAFIEPKIERGDVAYLPGDDPLISSAPLPEDPCGDDAEPDVIAGSPPAEPPIEEKSEGVGPESPGGDGGPPGGTIMGGFTDLLSEALEHSEVQASNPQMLHTLTVHIVDGDDGTTLIPKDRTWFVSFRTPSLVGTHLAAADGFPLRLRWVMTGTRWKEVGGVGSGIFGYSGFLNDDETAVYADVTVKLVELGIPNPSHNPVEVAAHPYIQPSNLAEFTAAIADPQTFIAAARVLGEIATWTIAGGSTQYSGGIERIIAIGGTGHAAGKIPIGSARLMALKVSGVAVPGGTFTGGPLTNVSHQGYLVSTFGDAIMTVLTPPPDPP